MHFNSKGLLQISLPDGNKAVRKAFIEGDSFKQSHYVVALEETPNKRYIASKENVFFTNEVLSVQGVDKKYIKINDNVKCTINGEKYLGTFVALSPNKTKAVILISVPIIGESALCVVPVENIEFANISTYSFTNY